MVKCKTAFTDSLTELEKKEIQEHINTSLRIQFPFVLQDLVNLVNDFTDLFIGTRHTPEKPLSVAETEYLLHLSIIYLDQLYKEGKIFGLDNEGFNIDSDRIVPIIERDNMFFTRIIQYVLSLTYLVNERITYEDHRELRSYIMSGHITPPVKKDIINLIRNSYNYSYFNYDHLIDVDQTFFSTDILDVACQFVKHDDVTCLTNNIMLSRDFRSFINNTPFFNCTSFDDYEREIHAIWYPNYQVCINPNLHLVQNELTKDLNITISNSNLLPPLLMDAINIAFYKVCLLHSILIYPININHKKEVLYKPEYHFPVNSLKVVVSV